MERDTDPTMIHSELREKAQSPLQSQFGHSYCLCSIKLSKVQEDNVKPGQENICT